jgi:hypothetical protein
MCNDLLNGPSGKGLDDSRALERKGVGGADGAGRARAEPKGAKGSGDGRHAGTAFVPDALSKTSAFELLGPEADCA